MRIGRYLVALVPLSAVWLYALGQSSGQILALIEEISGPAGQTPMQPAEDSADIEPADSMLARDPAPSLAPTDEHLMTHTPESRATGPEALPSPPIAADEADAYGAELEIDDRADPFAGQHEDITDPKIRKLLEPAWAD